MHLGIFARTFSRPGLEGTLDAIADHGLTHVQFNMSCCGLATLPARIDEDLAIRIAGGFRERGLTMAAISGTFNLCDPDASRLRDNLERLEVLASACRRLDTRIITLCTGTRDPQDMWRWHPENVRRDAWRTLVASMRHAVRIADRHEVTLAFEPEVNNVVNSVARARMLLDEVRSPSLKVVIDPANLLRAGDFARMEEILEEAMDWLGPDIVLAHAKNPETGRDRGDSTAIAACGELNDGRAADRDIEAEKRKKSTDTIAKASRARSHEQLKAVVREISSMEFPRDVADLQSFYSAYLSRLVRHHYRGALVLHGLPEEEVPAMRGMLAELIQTIRRR